MWPGLLFIRCFRLSLSAFLSPAPSILLVKILLTLVSGATGVQNLEARRSFMSGSASCFHMGVLQTPITPSSTSCITNIMSKAVCFCKAIALVWRWSCPLPFDVAASDELGRSESQKFRADLQLPIGLQGCREAGRTFPTVGYSWFLQAVKR